MCENVESKMNVLEKPKKKTFEKELCLQAALIVSSRSLTW